MQGELVYEEWESEVLPMSGVPNTYYRVFRGTVNWDRQPDTMRTAVCVLIQHGNTPDWREAKRRNEIRFQMPAHVLLEDVPAVLAAIGRLSAS